jgi:hypothetical protein
MIYLHRIGERFSIILGSVVGLLAMYYSRTAQDLTQGHAALWLSHICPMDYQPTRSPSACLWRGSRQTWRRDTQVGRYRLHQILKKLEKGRWQNKFHW